MKYVYLALLAVLTGCCGIASRMESQRERQAELDANREIWKGASDAMRKFGADTPSVKPVKPPKRQPFPGTTTY
jgi:hypothetical protein